MRYKWNYQDDLAEYTDDQPQPLKQPRPRRKTTRAHDRAKRIEAERARNHEIRQDPEKSRDDAYFPSLPPPPGEDEDPPPF